MGTQTEYQDPCTVIFEGPDAKAGHKEFQTFYQRDFLTEDSVTSTNMVDTAADTADTVSSNTTSSNNLPASNLPSYKGPFGIHSIGLDVHLNSKALAIKDLVKRLYLDDRCNYSEQEKIEQAILQRENISSTALDFGIAIPHCKSKYLKESSIIFLRLGNSIDWSNSNLPNERSSDKNENKNNSKNKNENGNETEKEKEKERSMVSMIFLLAIAEPTDNLDGRKKNNNIHLKLITNLSRKIIHQEFRDKLCFTNDYDNILKFLKSEVEVEL
ncbi:MAG: PTS sugar transporter subunit IIA [Oligoflexia bacterium]|nr:PTS sugar transporter subunit IIA [Oligoflexia bacterium]